MPKIKFYTDKFSPSSSECSPAAFFNEKLAKIDHVFKILHTHAVEAYDRCPGQSLNNMVNNNAHLFGFQVLDTNPCAITPNNGQSIQKLSSQLNAKSSSTNCTQKMAVVDAANEALVPKILETSLSADGQKSVKFCEKAEITSNSAQDDKMDIVTNENAEGKINFQDEKMVKMVFKEDIKDISRNFAQIISVSIVKQADFTEVEVDIDLSRIADESFPKMSEQESSLSKKVTSLGKLERIISSNGSPSKWSTDRSIATDKPITTEIPIGTDKPITTEMPTATDRSITTEKPTVTDRSISTEKPTATDRPIAAQRPIVTYRPVFPVNVEDSNPNTLSFRRERLWSILRYRKDCLEQIEEYFKNCKKDAHEFQKIMQDLVFVADNLPIKKVPNLTVDLSKLRRDLGKKASDIEVIAKSWHKEVNDINEVLDRCVKEIDEFDKEYAKPLSEKEDASEISELRDLVKSLFRQVYESNMVVKKREKEFDEEEGASKLSKSYLMIIESHLKDFCTKVNNMMIIKYKRRTVLLNCLPMFELFVNHFVKHLIIIGILK